VTSLWRNRTSLYSHSLGGILSTAFAADYITVLEDRRIMSVKYCLRVPVFHFRSKVMYPAARSLCDSWASCENVSPPTI